MLQRQLGRGWHAIEEAPLVEGAVWPTLTAGAVVRHHNDDRVVEFPGLLQEVHHATDLVVGVLDVAGEDLGHPDEQPLLIIGQRGPRAHGVEQRPGLAVGSGGGRLTVRVDARQLRVGRQQPELLLALKDAVADGLVAVVEHAPILVRPLREDVVRGVRGVQ